MSEFTIRSFMNLSNDSALNYIHIFNIEKNQTIYEGDYDECPNELLDKTIVSWNSPVYSNTNGLRFNIS